MQDGLLLDFPRARRGGVAVAPPTTPPFASSAVAGTPNNKITSPPSAPVSLEHAQARDMLREALQRAVKAEKGTRQGSGTRDCDAIGVDGCLRLRAAIDAANGALGDGSNGVEVPWQVMLERLADLETALQVVASPTKELAASPQKRLMYLQELVARIRSGASVSGKLVGRNSREALASLAEEATSLRRRLAADLAFPRDDASRKLAGDLQSVGAQLDSLVQSLGVSGDAAATAMPFSGGTVDTISSPESHDRTDLSQAHLLQREEELIFQQMKVQVFDGLPSSSREIDKKSMKRLASEAAVLANAHRDVLDLAVSANEAMDSVQSAVSEGADKSYAAIQEIGKASRKKNVGLSLKTSLGGAALGAAVGGCVAGPIGAAVGAGATAVASTAVTTVANIAHRRSVDSVMAAATPSATSTAASTDSH
eukprot:TRINITY_DN75404_c0_g1_i1.p1 TRINITY_DN75404_c0_g1~~TRINITY_DN75404_c0_g1_i1.p1  ORF type:complete len:425 (+),score=85.24 TRINITY_DN75404_c0_g1_i1:61-1335(+)